MGVYEQQYTDAVKLAVCRRITGENAEVVRVVLDLLMAGKLDVETPHARPSEGTVGQWKRDYLASMDAEQREENPSKLVEQMGERSLAVLDGMLKRIEERARSGKPREGDAAQVEKIMKAAKQCVKPMDTKPVKPSDEPHPSPVDPEPEIDAEEARLLAAIPE